MVIINNQQLMLTSDQTKSRIIALIVLNSIALAAAIGCVVVMVVGQYYGFSQATTIACTNTYFKLKFTSQNTFLSVSFVGAILAVASSIVLLIDLIVCRARIGDTQEKQINKITQNRLGHVYILVSLSLLGGLIPLGYMGSIIIQASNKCGTSIGINQLIIVGTAGLAEILFLVCWVIIIHLSTHWEQKQQQGEQAVKQGEKQELKEVKVEQQQVVFKDLQGIKELSIIKEISMVKEEQDKSVGKQKQKSFEKQFNYQQNQKMPLLDKSIYGQQKENGQVEKQKSFIQIFQQSEARKSKVSHDKSQGRPFLQVDQPIQRQKSIKQMNKAQQSFHQPIKSQKNYSYKDQYETQKQPEIKINKPPLISQKFYRSKATEHKIEKAQKVEVQVKPSPSQNTTHVTINFPTMQSNSFLPQTISSNKQQQPQSSQIPYSQSNDNTKSKHAHKAKKRHQQEVIKQSVEEQESQDSDDLYYKRERRSKKRNFNLDREKSIKSIKKGKFYQQSPNYQRQFDRIPSRFQQTPSEPRYILLSPESVKTFQNFLKEEKSNGKVNSRHFSKIQQSPDQTKRYSHIPTMKEQKKQQKVETKKQQQAKIQKVFELQVAPILRSNTSQIKIQNLNAQRQDKKPSKKKQGRKSIKKSQYYQSEVKEVKKNDFKGKQKKSKLKQLDGKQKSIYQQLNVVAVDSDDQEIKRYKQFFKSSRQAQKQESKQPNSSLQQYFNLLNSRVGNSNGNGDNSYNSLSNYSSVLNQQNKGKIPQQREHNTNKKINLQKNKIDSNRKSRQNIMQKIRHKYH